MASTYAYPAGSNRLISVTPSGQSARSFTYDASGDIVTDTRTGALGMSYQYDVEGRLSKAYQTNAPSQGGTYGYDAFDRLASRTFTSGATTTTTLYVHDLNDHIIAETNVSGQTLREYLWLNDLPIAVVDGVNTATPTLYYVHTDHLGRPARMVAQSWAWVWDVIYSPFGAVSAIFDSTTKLDMRFPGQWFQMESGLAYNWHRHYDATLGRYVQPDPIGLTAFTGDNASEYRDGPNNYGYVNGNPLAYIDPRGEFGQFAISWIIPSLPAIPWGPIIGGGIGAGAGWLGLTWLTAPGNVADTRIEKDYAEYASGQRLCGKTPMDRCEWLKANAKNYRLDQVKATEKAWGCRRSRQGR